MASKASATPKDEMFPIISKNKIIYKYLESSNTDFYSQLCLLFLHTCQLSSGSSFGFPRKDVSMLACHSKSLLWFSLLSSSDKKICEIISSLQDERTLPDSSPVPSPVLTNPTNWTTQSQLLPDSDRQTQRWASSSSSKEGLLGPLLAMPSEASLQWPMISTTTLAPDHSLAFHYRSSPQARPH